MIEFLSANIGTIIIALILIAVVTMIILKLKNDKKSGKSSCGCGCSGCPNSALCHGRALSSDLSFSSEGGSGEGVSVY